MLSGDSLRQTVYTHCVSVHQAAKMVAALLRVAGVTAGLVESNGSLPLGLWLTSPAGWLPRTGISSGTLGSVIEYGLTFTFLYVPARRPRVRRKAVISLFPGVRREHKCLQLIQVCQQPVPCTWCGNRKSSVANTSKCPRRDGVTGC